MVLTKSGQLGVQTSCSRTPQSARKVPELNKTELSVAYSVWLCESTPPISLPGGLIYWSIQVLMFSLNHGAMYPIKRRIVMAPHGSTIGATCP